MIPHSRPMAYKPDNPIGPLLCIYLFIRHISRVPNGLPWNQLYPIAHNCEKIAPEQYDSDRGFRRGLHMWCVLRRL